ncbi:helix-turn-helix domain-containing protein [Actinoplanes bogorensis]|uniref:Helix-turn-helix domain-containing protein n=1 Tax=Paractinoplanes bogorensis TaxID=1610840 RepID=A0ABS5YKN4_9ACTN|nr:helix-turn-helix domain-containing protein [Actinoplanes bogorensis]MBU2664033.1 helix-turn-helix domain-containing protein [Actinoplanes bogorensis]
MTTTEVAPLPLWAREAADAVDLPALAGRVVEADLAAAFETLRDHDEFVTRLRASVLENLCALRQVLTGRIPLTGVRLTEPFALAVLQARLRLPQTALQRSYRVGFLTMWQEWSDRLVERAEAEDVPRRESLEALQALTELVLAYQHHVASQVADSFARTDDVLSRSREHVRAGLVQHLLRDDSTPLPPADLVLLDYPLDTSHLAVLLPGTPEAAARQILDTLREKCHVRDTLVHPIDLTSTVVWLARPRRPELIADRLRALGVDASISEPHVGVQGIRDGWRQVRDMQQVRAAWGGGVLTYPDVSLEILLMADPGRARAFVRTELGELGADDEIAARLRETVEASHRHGSHVTTAAHLHLHEHTVRNRLQKAAELLGRPLTERRTELQAALRLARLLM